MANWRNSDEKMYHGHHTRAVPTDCQVCGSAIPGKSRLGMGFQLPIRVCGDGEAEVTTAGQPSNPRCRTNLRIDAMKIGLWSKISSRCAYTLLFSRGSATSEVRLRACRRVNHVFVDRGIFPGIMNVHSECIIYIYIAAFSDSEAAHCL